MKTTILFLSSNPITDAQLRLNREIQDSIDAIEKAIDGDRFTIETRLALRPRDLLPTLLKVKPKIVHFCGHGAENGLLLENDAGEPHLLGKEVLTDLFAEFSDSIECVILNACSTGLQAEAIAKHINYVIGMSQPILDRSAIAFSEGFYNALGAGESVPKAYNFGCIRIRLEISEIAISRKAVVKNAETPNILPVEEYLIPRLFTNKNLRKIDRIKDSSKSELTTSPVSSKSKQRLKDRLEDLEDELKDLRKILKELRKALATEADPLTKIKLGEQINERELRKNQLEAELSRIENIISNEP